jgi:hypothetical protein
VSAAFDLKTFLASLPAKPGVYLMFNREGEILYIGKARILKNRVTSYFRGRAHSDKTQALLSQVARLEVTVTSSETEALLLEYNLVQRHKPHYNVLLKDDKSFPFIHLTAHEYPRMAYFRGTRKGDGNFDASYLALMPFVRRPGPESDFHMLSPMEYHVSTSELFQMLRKGHHGVVFDADAWSRLTTWVDLNAPYYPSYASAYPKNPYGRSPLSGGQIDKLKQLGVSTGIIDISFDRPEISPGLAKLPKTDPRYAEALAIIREGQQALKKNPNPDAEGFVPCEADQQRDRKYEMRVQIERQNRAFIRDGKKIYDTPAPAP